MDHEETRDAETTTGGQGPTRSDKDSDVNGPCPPPNEMEEGKHQETPTGVEGFTINLGNVTLPKRISKKKAGSDVSKSATRPKDAGMKNLVRSERSVVTTKLPRTVIFSFFHLLKFYRTAVL